MKHYLEFKDDKSNKFWEITIKGKSFIVHFGKTGTEGQTQTKEFSSSAEAKEAAEKLLQEKLKKGYKHKGEVEVEKVKETKEPALSSDLSMIRRAFKKMNKGQVVALCNTGPTASGGMEDVSETAYERGGDIEDYSMIFWHNQSHDAFDRAGNLVGSLALHWAGDRLKLAKLLTEHLSNFQIEVPSSDHTVFKLASPPEPVSEIDPRNTVQCLRFLDSDREKMNNSYTKGELDVLREMVRIGEPKVMIYAAFLLDCGDQKFLNADDVANLLRRFEEIIKIKPGMQYWQEPFYTIKLLLNAMGRMQHTDYHSLIRQWARHKKVTVRAGVASHSEDVPSPSEHLLLLKNLLHDAHPKVFFAAIRSLCTLYLSTGRKESDAFFDAMLEPGVSKELISGCIELIDGENEFWDDRPPIKADTYAPRIRQLAKAVSDDPELAKRLLGLI